MDWIWKFLNFLLPWSLVVVANANIDSTSAFDENFKWLKFPWNNAEERFLKLEETEMLDGFIVCVLQFLN